jgi:hypothetical protein
MLTTVQPRTFASSRSMLNEPGFWLGGNSLNVWRNLPTYACAGVEHKEVLDAPSLVVHAFVVRGFERIAAQVEELGKAQSHERVLPDLHAVLALFGENDFPLVVAQADQLSRRR